MEDPPQPTLAPPDRPGGVYGTALILTLTGLYACWCGTALIWDGAPQFCRTLAEQVPYAYGGWLGRFHSRLVWAPVVPASRLTSDAGFLQALYGLPFVLAPVAGLLLSWWVVKRPAPGLVLWAVFGVAAAPLPGQIFIINDSIFQQHLFWPVFLGAMVPLTPARRVVLTLLALMQLSQPIGFVLLAGAAGAAAIVGLVDRRNRRRQWVRAGLLLGLAVLVPLKVRFLQPDTQASVEMTWVEVMKRWHMGVEGAPLTGLTFMWAAAVLVFAAGLVGRSRSRERAGKWLDRAAVACALVGGAVWVAWASDEHRWKLALDYRRWLVPLSFPFFALALWEACRYALRREAGSDNRSTRAAPATVGAPTVESSTEDDPPPLVPRQRKTLSFVLAGVYAAVLGIQCTLWLSMVRRLMDDVRAYPAALVPRTAVPWVKDTALDHWTLPSVVAAEQGARQEKVLLFDPPLEAHLRQDPPRVPLGEWDIWPVEPNAAGWFDFRPFFAEYGRTDPPPRRDAS